MTQISMFPKEDREFEQGWTWAECLTAFRLGEETNKAYEKFHKRASIVKKHKLAEDFWTKYSEFNMWASLEAYLTPKAEKVVSAKRAWSNFIKYSEDELKQYYVDVEVRVAAMKARTGIPSIQ